MQHSCYDQRQGPFYIVLGVLIIISYVIEASIVFCFFFFEIYD